MRNEEPQTIPRAEKDRRYMELFEKLSEDKLRGSHGEQPIERCSPDYVMPIVASYVMCRSAERQEDVAKSMRRHSRVMLALTIVILICVLVQIGLTLFE